jgi:hypothetical protein
MQTTDITQSLAPDLVKRDWNFLEVWIDPMQSPPYLLMLMADDTGHCHIFDPAEGYRLVKSCDRYDDAQHWLLEDEFEPLEGRLAGLES